ncbi:MAG: DUF3098 domain-containing protein [Flavobacteriales bacterium TMED191]|nr:MAG: DUF3098 domain-containing protein [Flavobacteriales bacterium TMED191]
MSNKNTFLFNKSNYLLLIISIVIIIIGFLLMKGGGGTTDFEFNEEIFSTKRIIIAPIIVIVGYIGLGFAIFYND